VKVRTVDRPDPTHASGDEPPLDHRDDAASSDELVVRIAIYDERGRAPRLVIVKADSTASLIEAAGDRIAGLVTEAGGGVPTLAIREVVDNLVHAGPAGAVVTVLEGGDTVRVSDRGPGIADKDRARAPGFTTAGPSVQALVRGVGAGLAIASDLMAQANGTMEIDDNLGRGTVVTLRVPPGDARPLLSEDRTATTADLTDRQLRALLLIVDLGPVGPTRIAKELLVSTSTAFRDLLALHDFGFVEADPKGCRSATEEGLRFLQTVL
jgi:anti-sigma regulatory factor (Ser/Thr protein kinase)